MISKFVTAAAFATLAFATQAQTAAPTEFDGYCMVVTVGNAPGQGVKVAYNDKFEFHRDGDLSYQIRYGDSLRERNVLALVIYNKATNRQSVAEIFVRNEFPSRIDLISEMGTISCFEGM